MKYKLTNPRPVSELTLDNFPPVVVWIDSYGRISSTSEQVMNYYGHVRSLPIGDNKLNPTQLYALGYEVVEDRYTVRNDFDSFAVIKDGDLLCGAFWFQKTSCSQRTFTKPEALRRAQALCDELNEATNEKTT